MENSANTTPKKITILLPAYNEEENILLIKEKMLAVAAENAGYTWEFLLVNDGSYDRTLFCYEQLRAEDDRFCYVDLSRNFGKEVAMLAGLDYATGDAVIIMDSDMQHPIDVIPQMLALWNEGYKDVYAVRCECKESWTKRTTSALYYKLLQHCTRVPIQKNTGDFRLLDRQCVKALRRLRETERNMKGLYSWMGFRKKGIPYRQLQRQNGRTKWNYWALTNLAIEGITSYTTAPLRMASILGIAVSALAFAYLVFIVTTTLLFGERVTGYPTVMVTILFLGGVQLISLGIIGEYLGKVFKEAKGRPAYFINSYNGADRPPLETQPTL